jgi:hypothetical protein
MLTTILLGGMTHHYIGSSLPYCNKINDLGTITNPYVVVMAGDTKIKSGFILGTDSACGTIVGPVSSIRLADNLDFVLGAYNTNFRKFNDLGIEPSTVTGLTPIIGFNYKIPITTKISLDNILSFRIVSQALSTSF